VFDRVSAVNPPILIYLQPHSQKLVIYAQNVLKKTDLVWENIKIMPPVPIHKPLQAT
jgi:hypothetical protein